MSLGLTVLLALGLMLVVYSMHRVRNGERAWIPGVIVGAVLTAASVFLITATLLLIWGID